MKVQLFSKRTINKKEKQGLDPKYVSFSYHYFTPGKVYEVDEVDSTDDFNTYCLLSDPRPVTGNQLALWVPNYVIKKVIKE